MIARVSQKSKNAKTKGTLNTAPFEHALQDYCQQTHPAVIRGRFAPSPTGELHLGSLLTAVASYCAAKHAQGSWLVRIEDTDTQRCHSRYTQSILSDLERFGLYWDESVLYQSQRIECYQAHLHDTLRPHIYACQCSRKSLQQYQQKHPPPQHISTSAYPQLCRHKALPIAEAGTHSRYAHNLRLHLPDITIAFCDILQGLQKAQLQQDLGDPIVRRRNGIINYILAVSIDDAYQGITQLIRGIDIMTLTASQLGIMALLGAPRIPIIGHLPVLVNAQQQKLSKQTLAQPIRDMPVAQTLQLVLNWLRQPPIDLDTPHNMLQQAVTQWDITPLAGVTSITYPNTTSTQ